MIEMGQELMINNALFIREGRLSTQKKILSLEEMVRVVKYGILGK